MSYLKDNDAEYYGSMIYEQISQKKSASCSELASGCKISVRRAEQYLGELREQGLVVNRGDLWCLPRTDDSSQPLEDSEPFSEGALCSQLEKNHISDDTRLKSFDDNSPDSTHRKSYLDDLESTLIKLPVQSKQRRAQSSNTGALSSPLEKNHTSEDTRLKSFDDNSPHSTHRKSYVDDSQSTHIKLPVQSKQRRAQSPSTERDETDVKTVSDRSHSDSPSNLRIEQISSGGSQSTIRGTTTGTRRSWGYPPLTNFLRIEAHMDTPKASERFKDAGLFQLSTNAPVQAAYRETPDSGLRPHYDNILKIINLFKTGETNVKPHEVARKTGLGSWKKDVNKMLYSLEKKKILQVKCNKNKGNPLWSAGEKLHTYTNNMILECAAEVAKGVPAQKQAEEGTGDVHVHHHHHHEHNTYLQVGQENKLLSPQDPGLGRMTRSLPPSGRKS